MAALPHGLDITLCLVHFLLGIEQGFLLFSVHVLLVRAVGVYHLRERGGDAQVRDASAVEGERHVAVIIGVHNEVGGYLLQAASFCLAKGCPRLGIELSYLFMDNRRLLGREAHRLGYLVPMLLDEVVEMMADDLFHEALEFAFRPSGNLQEQALLERAGANAGGIEGLQNLQHLLNLFHRHINAVIDGQLIADVVKALSEQSIAVERADKILHDLLLLLSELCLSHLLFELVVERCGVAPYRLLIVGVRISL